MSRAASTVEMWEARPGLSCSQPRPMLRDVRT